MKLSPSPAPHIRYPETNRTMMLDTILLLLLLTIPAFLFYGYRALVICAVSVVTAYTCDFICTAIRGKKFNPRDLSAVVTGMIIALTMPATIPYYVILTADIFAIAVVKHPFGGVGNNVFNPAAAGFCFSAICWPQVFLYPQPFDKPGIFGIYSEKLQAFVYQAGADMHDVTVNLFQNPSFVLQSGRTPTNDLVEMALGNYPGPMGATSILVIVTCLIYLLFRRNVRWQLPVSFLASCAAVAFIFPRVITNSFNSVAYELMSGTLLFSAVFMITDPVTSPKRDSSFAIYGVFAGVTTMLFRYYGGFEESVPFAVLLANAFVPAIDHYNEYLHRIIRRKRFEAKEAKEAPSE